MPGNSAIVVLLDLIVNERTSGARGMAGRIEAAEHDTASGLQNAGTWIRPDT
jgi:hypothetical protein